MRRRFWRRWVARFLLRRADAVRVVSSQVAENLQTFLGIDRRRIFVAPVPAVSIDVTPDLSQADARARLAPELVNAAVVVFAGRFVEAKNLMLWIEVAETVADRISDIHFVLAGSGPDQPSIRSRIDGSRHQDKFVLPGELGATGLADVYRSADVFLLTSNHEGFGRVVVEAGLAGLPVVSTDCAGPSELLLNGETGLLCPIGDRNALADAVASLLRDKSLAARMGRAARLRTEAEFSETGLVDRLVTCWTDVSRL